MIFQYSGGTGGRKACLLARLQRGSNHNPLPPSPSIESGSFSDLPRQLSVDPVKVLAEIFQLIIILLYFS